MLIIAPCPRAAQTGSHLPSPPGSFCAATCLFPGDDSQWNTSQGAHTSERPPTFLREGFSKGGGGSTFLAKGPDSGVDPFRNVPCRRLYSAEREERTDRENP